MPVKNPFIRSNRQTPLVIAHGGAKKLWPENTLLAFQSATELGVDGLEIDIRMTKDQVLVAHHNAMIDKTSDGQGLISELSYKELQAFNFGYWFQGQNRTYPYRKEHIPLPKVKELLTEFQDKILILELKDKGSWGMRAAEKLSELLKLHLPNSHMVVASFRNEVMKHFARITAGKVLTSAPKKEAAEFVTASKSGLSSVHHPPDKLLHLPAEYKGLPLATEEIIRDAHTQNIAVHYWTINKAEQMQQMISLGADGIVTDRPDILLKIISEKTSGKI